MAEAPAGRSGGWNLHIWIRASLPASILSSTDPGPTGEVTLQTKAIALIAHAGRVNSKRALPDFTPAWLFFCSLFFCSLYYYNSNYNCIQVEHSTSTGNICVWCSFTAFCAQIMPHHFVGFPLTTFSVLARLF